jgi:antitoxin ChpS
VTALAIREDDAGVVPGSADERRALERYARAVKDHYGERQVEIVLFGSRARGDAHAHSNADEAGTMKDGTNEIWQDRFILAGSNYDILIDDGLSIQGWPLTKSVWAAPSKRNNPSLVRNIQRDMQSLLVPI